MQPFARFVEREPISDESCEKQSAALGYQGGRGETRFLLKNQESVNQELIWNVISRFGISEGRIFQARLSVRQRASASLLECVLFVVDGLVKLMRDSDQELQHPATLSSATRSLPQS